MADLGSPNPFGIPASHGRYAASLEELRRAGRFDCRTPQALRRAMETLRRDQAGPAEDRARPHAQTQCSQLLATAGVPASDIAAQLGHKDGGALALKVYVHPMAEGLTRAGVHLDQVVGG